MKDNEKIIAPGRRGRAYEAAMRGLGAHCGIDTLGMVDIFRPVSPGYTGLKAGRLPAD